MICVACRLLRDPADLLAFWPVGRDGERRHVCRPTRPTGPLVGGPCFGRAVGPVSVHAIALAAPAAALVVERIRPWTPAWWGLMREAGVRAA